MMSTSKQCNASSAATQAEALRHAYSKIFAIAFKASVKEAEPSPREILQVGYNLGRISEITGEGREIWDTTKGMVECGDWGSLCDWANSRGMTLDPPED